MTDQPASHRRAAWPLAFAETLVWAGLFYSFPALLPHWEADLGWSKTELSAAFTLALVASALIAPVWGRFIDQGHGRILFAAGAAAGGCLLLALSQATQLWQFYALWVCIGVSAGACLYEACFSVLTVMLGAEAKKAITLVTLIAGFAGTVAFPAADVMAEVAGWRGALQAFAALILAVAVPLIWFGARGADHARARVAANPATARRAKPVTREASFWLLAGAWVMTALGHGAVMTHMLPILDDRGLHPETAVLAASMIGPMQVAGRLAMMAAERHVSTLTIALGTYVATGLAAAALLGAGAASGLIVAFVVLHGAGYGVTSITRPVVVADVLGREGFGVTSGLLAIAFVGGGAAAPTAAALLWESGGYDMVLAMVIGASALGMTALFAAWRVSRAQ